MSSTSSKFSSGPSSSSASLNAELTDPRKLSNKDSEMKSTTASSKSQCDLCKLSYSEEKMLTEHLLSLMHHTKLEEKEANPVHNCILCKREFSCMMDYREHIGTNQHKKNLYKLRQENRKENERQGEWQASTKWSGQCSHPPPDAKRDYDVGTWGGQSENMPWSGSDYHQGPNPSNYGYGGYSNYCNDQSMNNEENRGRGGHDKPGRQDHYKVCDTNRNNPSWGSGARWGNGYDYGYGGDNTGIDFTEDHIDFPSYDAWLQQHENYLAGMYQYNPFKEPPVAPASRNDRSNREKEYSGLYSYPSGDWQRPSRLETQSKDVESVNKDRKRHREDDVQESLSKTLKPYEYGIGSKSSSTKEVGSHIPNNASKKPLKQRSSQEIYTPGSVQVLGALKSPPEPQKVDNTCENLLERAERLCKELREKRESSHAWRSKLFRTNDHHGMSDKMSALAKKQQSYIKGHIKDNASDIKSHIKDNAISKSQNKQSTGYIKQLDIMHEAGTEGKDKSEPLRNLYARTRSLEDIRNSIEKSVIDKPAVSEGKSQPVDEGKGMAAIRLKDQQRATSQDEQRKTRLSREEERDANYSSSYGEAAGASRRLISKQILSKDSLLKMVNSPVQLSRTERAQLARMVQTRGDSKSNPSPGSRTNINLEGLYDSQVPEDIHLDLGPGVDTSVIKLEDLSENVRNQIMSIIGGDLAGSDAFLSDCSNAKVATEDKNASDRKSTAGKSKSVKKKSATSALPCDKLGKNRDKEAFDESTTNFRKVAVGDKPDVERRKRHSSDEKRMDSSKSRDVDRLPCGKPHALGVNKGSSRMTSDSDLSLTLSSENIMTRFPTIMSSMSAKELSPYQGSNTSDIPCDSSNSLHSTTLQSADLQSSHRSAPSSSSNVLPLTQNQPSQSLSTGNDSIPPTILPASQKQFSRSLLTLSSGNDSIPPTILPVSQNQFSKSLSSLSSGIDSIPPTILPVSQNQFCRSLSTPLYEKDSIPPTGMGLKTSSQGMNPHLIGGLNTLGDDQSSTSSSRGRDGNQSEVMSELLQLSEREENVKQEMMTMELRLTRLHRLLEQAVNQINQCTDRRNELQEEEKNLTSQRMSLLRAVSSRQSSKASGTDVHRSSVDSASSREFRNPAPPLANLRIPPGPNQKAPDSTQENVSDPQEDPSKSSLTRSEWLAKFSAFLPSNPFSSTAVSCANNYAKFTSPITSPLASQAVLSSLSSPSLSHHAPVKDSAMPVENALRQNSSKVADLKDCDSNSLRASSLMTAHLNEKNSRSDFPAFPSTSLPSDVQSRESNLETGMDFLLSNAVLGGSTPVSLEHDGLTTSAIKLMTFRLQKDDDRKITKNAMETVDGKQMEPTRDITTVTPSAPKRHDFPVPLITSPRNEDSDISSIASLASGSSLGEKISLYCRRTTGASLEVPGRHNLSVILSGPSDSNDLKGLEDQDSNNDSASAETKKTLYGNLSKDVVKSAEALHLMERNGGEGVAGMTPASLDKEMKKKKRRTKHERNTGVTSRRRRYIISSSSEAEEVVGEQPLQGDSPSAIDSIQRRPLESTCEDSSSDVVEIKTVSSQRKNTQSLAADVTIAECDSSTNLGIVDTASINAQSNRLKEMNESFVRTFGRTPKFQGCKVKKTHKDSVIQIDGDDGEKSKATQTNSNLSKRYRKESEVVNLCSDSEEKESQWNEEREVICVSGDERSPSWTISSQVKESKFPSTLGGVCYLKVIKGKLYVGYHQFGVQVYDLLQERNLTEKGACFYDLKCMDVTETDKRVTIWIGHGCNVRSIQDETGVCASTDLGTDVSCFHLVDKHWHVGLDTGEICVLNNELMKVNRYICMDCPIYSMASGQEGSTRLLCVASLDSTITVMDAERCLPLRILLGHSKTSFSLQVHASFVYSASGDGTVMVHNMHTASVEQIHKDNEGIVNCVFYSKGFLFTGGLDRLVRCYNTKTHKLVQHYFGADMGAIKSIFVHDKMLITGNTSGSVDVVTIDLKAKNICPKSGCAMNFGLKSHLTWHLKAAHQDRSQV